MNKNKTHLLRAYFYKLLTSPNVYIGIIGIASLSFFSIFVNNWGCLNDTVISNFDYLLNVDATRKIIVILGAVSFAANFAEEWNNSVTTSVALRCGTRKYAISNIICVFVSSIITVFLGIILFVGIAALFADKFSTLSGSYRKPFAPIFENNVPFFYVAYKSFVLAVSCGTWSVIGLAVSAFFPNKYVAVTAPIVISYLLERATFFNSNQFCIVQLQIGELGFNSLWGQLFYCIGFFTVLAAAGGAVFYVILKRRVQNEIT